MGITPVHVEQNHREVKTQNVWGQSRTFGSFLLGRDVKGD
jgi:hypothetical protein